MEEIDSGAFGCSCMLLQFILEAISEPSVCPTERLSACPRARLSVHTCYSVLSVEFVFVLPMTRCVARRWPAGQPACALVCCQSVNQRTKREPGRLSGWLSVRLTDRFSVKQSTNVFLSLSLSVSLFRADSQPPLVRSRPKRPIARRQ